MKYNPNKWTGNYYTEIFTEVLESVSLVESNLINVIDNVKDRINLTTMSGGFQDKPYSSLPVFDANGDTISFGDITVQPEKRMVYEEIDMDLLRGTRFSESMKAGAANTESSEFDKLVIDYAGSKWKTAITKRFLSQIMAKAKGSVTAKVAVDVNATNVFETLEELYQLTPDEVLAEGDAYLMLDNSFRKFVQAANAKDAYRDKIVKDGKDFYIHDLKLVFQPLGAGNGLVTRAHDTVLATDLTYDFGALQVGKKFEYADILFIKGVYSLDSALLVPEQKVILTSAAPAPIV